MLPVLICHLMFVHTLPCKDNANHTQNITFFLNIMSTCAFYRKKNAVKPNAASGSPFHRTFSAFSRRFSTMLHLKTRSVSATPNAAKPSIIKNTHN